MSRYDEDQVIALLRDSVPAAPDDPDRLGAVRHRAGRQRARIWTQSLGAVASVLLVVGLAAAVDTGGGREIGPTSDPLTALTDAFGREDSVRFEATLTQIAGSRPGMPSIDSRMSGAATRDGDLRFEGDLAFMGGLGGYGDDDESYAMKFVILDGVQYRSAMKYDGVPPGKKWVSSGTSEEADGVEDLDRILRIAKAFATDVRFVRETEVRGEPVAEYRLTIPAAITRSVAVDVTFALDAENRLRRVESEIPYWKLLTAGEDGLDMPQGMMDMVVRVELNLFGYGDDVGIEAPPASEVVAEDSIQPDNEFESSPTCATPTPDPKASWTAFCEEVESHGAELSPPPDSYPLFPSMEPSATP